MKLLTLRSSHSFDFHFSISSYVPRGKCTKCAPSVHQGLGTSDETGQPFTPPPSDLHLMLHVGTCARMAPSHFVNTASRFASAVSMGLIASPYFCIAPSMSSDAYSFNISPIEWPVR